MTRASDTSAPAPEFSIAESIRARRRVSFGQLADGFFFLFAAVSAAWLVVLIVVASFTSGWAAIGYLLCFWAVLSYLVLPRIHSILTLIYVPDYFIGRARTREGLLGDPINIALFGSAAQIRAAMETAGWTLADDLGFRSSWRIVSSTIRRRSYDEAPVSPLYLFGDMQEFAYQREEDGNPAQRHHVRFWRCPEGWLLPGGHRAQWLAAGTYDRRVGLSLFTLQFTHKIDRDTDTERDFIVDSLVTKVPETKVHVIRNFSTAYHAVNGGGDAISTDGDLPQVDLRGIPAQPPLGADAPPRTAIRRPASIYAGVLLIYARILASALSIVTIALSPAALDERLIQIAITAAVLIPYAVLVWRVFMGSHLARLITMTLSSAAILAVAIQYFAAHSGMGPGRLLGVGFDILVLLALSGEDARKYALAHRDRHRKRTRNR